MLLWLEFSALYDDNERIRSAIGVVGVVVGGKVGDVGDSMLASVFGAIFWLFNLLIELVAILAGFSTTVLLLFVVVVVVLFVLVTLLVFAALVVPVLLFLSSIGIILDAGLPTGLVVSDLFSFEFVVDEIFLELDTFLLSVVWPSIIGASL